MVVGPTKLKPRLERFRQRLGLGGAADGLVGGCGAACEGANDQRNAARPPSARSATVARAFWMVARTLRWLRMMPSSAMRRATSASVNVARRRVEAWASRPERLPLAEDGGPRQPGLEHSEAEGLEQAALVVYWYAPFLVVVVAHRLVSGRPSGPGGRTCSCLERLEAPVAGSFRGSWSWHGCLLCGAA